MGGVEVYELGFFVVVSGLGFLEGYRGGNGSRINV